MPSGQPPLRRSRYPPDESGILPSKNIITRRLKSLFRMRFPGPFLPGLVLLLLLMPVFKVHGSSYQITGMGFYWPYQGGVKFRLDSDKDKRLDIKMCRGSSEAKYLGTGTLARKNARSVKDIFIFTNIHLKAEKAGGPECQRQDYWPFFAIFNVRYWSLMLSAFRHFIITDWRSVFCQHSRFAFFL